MSYIPTDSTCPVCRAYPGENCPHRGRAGRDFKIVQHDGWTYEYEYEYSYDGTLEPSGAHISNLRAWDSQGNRAYWRNGGWVTNPDEN